MVSELTSDIDPGPGGSSGKAGHAGSWPACIGFLVPELAVCIRPSADGCRERWIFLQTFFCGSTCPFCAILGWMEGGYMYILTGGCMKSFSSDGEVMYVL